MPDISLAIDGWLGAQRHSVSWLLVLEPNMSRLLRESSRGCNVGLLALRKLAFCFRNTFVMQLASLPFERNDVSNKLTRASHSPNALKLDLL